jgi:hypothetical protein
VKIQDTGVFVCSSGSTCKKLDESAYLAADVKTDARCGISEFNISTGGYFVM